MYVIGKRLFKFTCTGIVSVYFYKYGEKLDTYIKH
jgi:hypothetical protein